MWCPLGLAAASNRAGPFATRQETVNGRWDSYDVDTMRCNDVSINVSQVIVDKIPRLTQEALEAPGHQQQESVELWVLGGSLNRVLNSIV